MDLEDIVSRAKWQEEDDDGDNVKDNWDDEDEEPPKPAATDSKKSDKAKGKAQNKNKSAETKTVPLTPLEKKKLEEKLQQESDLKLTKQMLGMEDKDISLEFPLETKEDFDRFHKNLVHKLWCYDKSPHYYLLLDKIIRDLCVPLEADELKSLSAALNALFNEKVKVSRNKPKKKGTKGLAIKIERDAIDRDDYMDELDDIM